MVKRYDDLKGSIRQIRKHPPLFQIYFTKNKKRYFISKDFNRNPLRTKGQAYSLLSTVAKNKMPFFTPDRLVADHSYDFNRLIQKWISLSNCSPEWLSERKRLIEKVFIPYFGKKNIREIKTTQIDEFQKSLQDKGLSTKYIKNVMGELRAFFRFNKKILTELPEFRKIEVQSPPIIWLSEEDQDKVFEFLPKEHLPIFTFLRFYGCRLNEACGVLRKNIFLKHNNPYIVLSSVIGEKGQLKHVTKTKRIKVLPIILESKWIFKSSELPVSPLFFSHKGKPYTSRKLYRLWERASKKANKKYGVQILNVYNSMRHSWACQRLNQGFSLDQISTVMGHSSTQMSKRYAQYAVEKLSDVIRGKRKPSVHRQFTHSRRFNLSNLKGNMVGGTGLEPATSGL